MCTVSFIPLKNNDFIFTSNRDEAIGRNTLNPDFYMNNGIKTWMPKDEKSDGTWIGATNNKRVVCLLNGAFEAHVKKSTYRHSRGVVVNDFLVIADYVLGLENYNLDNIEPFTLIIVDWSADLQLTELVWDGTHKKITHLPLENKIWCSATLYTPEMKKKRTHWFSDFVAKNNLTQESVLDFHQNYSVGDKNIDLQIDRGNLKTVSITSIAKKDAVLKLYYVDLLKNKSCKSAMNATQTLLHNA